MTQFVQKELTTGLALSGANSDITSLLGLTGPVNEALGTAVASAATTNLQTATANLVHITGTTTITAITLNAGVERTVVFDGSLTLTNSGTLVLPGAANIVTQAGDVAIFRGDSSSTVRCVAYFSNAGLVLRPLYYRLNTAVTLNSTIATAQSILGVGVSLLAGMQYEFELAFNLNTSGVTSHTEAIGFGGTATLNNIHAEVTRQPVSTTATAAQGAFLSAATNTVITGAITTAQNVNYLIKGTVSVNAGGTFIPQFTFSAGPTGTSTIAIGAYMKLTPIAAAGSNAAIGTWA